MSIQVGSKVKIVKDTVFHRLPIGSIQTVDRVIDYGEGVYTACVGPVNVSSDNYELIEEESE